ncbi:Gfo/Idh/MocA family oxidoreductase [Brachybacterium sp. Z12]|uniref:Gfo/Idh/MocA family oxidoreductase n=1 Tax=Brachybacterium sp. Z12 TaxID=2759167 RepID=UPI00223BFBEE|nr:Gfo/Idh/MocA family oxidoreductase [Brachybacterium sp. Z12]
MNIEPQIGSRTFEFGTGFANEIQNFVDASLGRAESVAPAWHGVEIVRILEAIYESAAAGREISLV